MLTVERAVVLDPDRTVDAASIDADITDGFGQGLMAGAWSYRIAAVMGTADADNPGGETLPSDPVVVRVPPGATAAVSLTWNALPGAVAYRVYRSPMADAFGGGEQLLPGDQPAPMYFDGSTMAPSGAPLPLGTTGAWQALPPANQTREAPSVAAVADPADPTTIWLYAMLGRGAGSTLANYERLPISVAADGTQSVGRPWTFGPGALGTPRSQMATAVASHDADPSIPDGATWIFLAGGTTDGANATDEIDAASVAPGGVLTPQTPRTGLSSFGAAGASAGDAIYVLGGPGPDATIRVAPLAGPIAGPFSTSATALATPRYLPGAVLAGPALCVTGGSAVGRSAATASFEWMVP
jgi:hypothetical protein